MTGPGYDWLRQHFSTVLQRSMSDAGILIVRYAIFTHWGLNMSKEATATEMDTLALMDPFHPIGEWLDGLEWDRTERLSTWLHAKGDIRSRQRDPIRQQNAVGSGRWHWWHRLVLRHRGAVESDLCLRLVRPHAEPSILL